MASSGRRLHRRGTHGNGNGSNTATVELDDSVGVNEQDKPKQLVRKPMKRQKPVNNKVEDNGLDEYIDDDVQQNNGRGKSKKPAEPDNRLPADYVGGIDPLAIVALFFSSVPIVGLVLGYISYKRYKNKIYDDGRFLAIIAIIIGLLALIGAVLGCLAIWGLMQQPSAFQTGMGTMDMGMDANGDYTYMSDMVGTME